MNKKMRTMLVAVCMVFCASMASAQSHWGTVDEHAFQYDMSVYFTLQHGEGTGATTFANADLDNYEIAAFVNGELRGVGEWQTKVVNEETKKWGYIRIRSNKESGETVTFKYYDKNEQKEKTVYGNTGKIDFVSQKQEGTASAPHGFDMDNNVLPGDVNGDEKINTVDLSLLIGKILGKSDPRFIEDAGDLDSNGKFNTVDLALLIKLILNK